MLALSGTAYAFGQGPVANFRADKTSGCAPLTVTFTDQSTGNPTEWNWEFSNGTLSSVKNPVVAFSTPGTYSVKLVVRNANGIDQIEKTDYIIVFPSPIADYSADITLGCVPVTVKFTDHSTTPVGTVVKWEWDFGDGTTSTQQNPSHTYAITGFYTVALRVYNSTGCERRISRGRYIRVVDGVNTDFNFSLPSSCKPPFVVNFQNQSSGPGAVSYTWNFGNGQTSTATNPSVIFNAPGTYKVRLNAQSSLGCRGTITKDVVITQTNTDFTSPLMICVEQPTVFQNNSSAIPETSFWDFGDGTTSAQTNPVKTFLTAGVYTVRLINSYENCTDSSKKTVTVIDKPAVDFQANTTSSCQAPLNVQFTDLTPGATSWFWDFGDGNTSTLQNPSHVFTSVRNYTVKLVASTSTDCADSITKVDFIKIQETSVQFDNGGGCIPYTYSPVPVIETLDPIASYLWTFGDGATSTQQNPSHTYTVAGNYNISLTVTTVSGCTKTIPKTNGVRTGTPPIVSFTATPLTACASQSVFFAGQATTTPGADVKWSWDFDDGSGSSAQSPTHIFLDTGSLIVRLTVSNNGCEDFAVQTLQINPPKAIFDYTVNCNTRAVTFVNKSLVNPTLTPTSYKWNMGDPLNTESTLQTPPVFSYPSTGIYTVTLIIENGLCSDTLRKPVTIVDEKADFSINKNPVCKNETFTLSTINSNADNIAGYVWRIGSTIAGRERTLNYQLPATGLYNVSLTITDINKCADTKTVNNYIDVKGSVARFVPTTPGGCMNKTVTFDAQSSTSTTNLVKWDWNFGDGTQQSFTAPPFTHIYSKIGRYNVSLTVTDATGCTDKYTLPTALRVTNPLVGFRADTFYCPQAPLQFVDTSSGTGLTYLWSFGDGSTSTLQNPKNSYPLADATYSVKLKIRDISGCEDSVTKTDYIKIRSPKSAFDIKDTATFCPPLRTSFTFKGTDYKSFYWDFGDGGRSGLQNPSYFYSDYGHFIPKLYLVGPGGCIDSAESSVSVYDPFASTKINYVLPTGPICNSLNVDFTLVVPSAFKFYFHFGDGVIDSSGRKTLSHFYSRPGLNSPRIELFDTISGCQISIPGNPRINVLGAVPLFGKDKKEFCDQGVVKFKNFTTKNDPIISNVWTFGDGTTSSELEPSHNFTQPGIYIVKLEVTTLNNCSKSFSDTIRVYQTPSPIISGRDTICVNVADPYNAALEAADTVTTWKWNFGNGQTSTQQNNNITYATPGNYSISLTATNKIGCFAEDTKNIYVSPLPTAIPEQDPLTIASGSGANILMNYTGNIATYNWIPTTRLSCTDCPLPYANPQFTTKYTVQLIDNNGCKNSGDITVLVVCGKQNFFVPNTFSPNGDGRNETFYPKGTGLFRIKSMRVFNRWGEIVFEKKDFAANDPSAGWNGTYKGKTASPDAYIYTMEILCENNTVIPVTGNVTLLR